MPQVLKCPNAACGKPIQIADGMGGRQMQCPTCKKPFVVPAAKSGGSAAGVQPKPAMAGAAAGGSRSGGSSPGAPAPPSMGNVSLPGVPPGGGGNTKCPAC